MSRPRAYIGFKTKLCSALCNMMHEVDGKLVKILTHDEAKLLSEDQILALFAWDHDVIPHAEDGPDAHWNIFPTLHPVHDEKTAKIDIPRIAKNKRIASAHQEMAERFCAKIFHPDLLKPKKKRSNFPAGRKIPSRPFNRKKERP